MIELSICLIVKDEEENLDAALSSVAGAADETVVVDTGSTDRTVAVAERHGARVALFDPTTNPEAFFRDDKETCSAFGAPEPYSGEMMLGDFAAARRKSFSLARGEFIYWMDADDVVENAHNLRNIVRDLRGRNLDIAFLAYDYARDAQGRTFYRQWRERVIRAGCASWVNPVHEVLLPTRPVSSAQYEGVVNVHRRKADRKTVPNRNYKILLRQYEAERRSGSFDPRTLFYLGQEARWIQPVRAAGYYEDYLKRSGWPEERAAAHVALGSMHEFGELGGAPEEAYARADREYATAAAEHPNNPDGLFGLARIAYLRGRWAECVMYTERARAIGNTDTMLGTNPMDRLYRPHVYLNHALFQLGRVEEAIASCEEALKVCPDDPGVRGGAAGMVQHNLAEYRRLLASRQQPSAPASPTEQCPVIEFDKNESLDSPPASIPRDALVIWGIQLWKRVLHVEKNPEKAEQLLQALPSEAQGDPVYARMLETTKAAKVGAGQTSVEDDDWLSRASQVIKKVPGGTENVVEFYRGSTGVSSGAAKKRVVLWVGPSIEPWDPNTPNTTGIGGSETAAIEMARHLAKSGHDVTVYGDLPGKNSVDFDGVHYAHYSQARAPIACDVFVSSRAPAVMMNPDDVRAVVKLLWVHDVGVGDPSPEMERWLLRFDRVLCLSQWHRSTFLQVYPFVDPARVLVTRNGVDPMRFDGPMPAKHNRLVFSSSPNRGLPTLLHNFDFVRQRVPDAELHIFYGFDCWEKFARARGAQHELDEIERYRRLIREAEARGGVKWHGRVSQKKLAEAFLEAKVWAYPTEFTETSCISAMEAQAAGCVSVCSALAALNETVRYGLKIEPGPSYGRLFVDGVVRALTDETWRRSVAEPSRRWALENLGWDKVAAEWAEMFDRVAEEVRANPLPAYVGVAK